MITIYTTNERQVPCTLKVDVSQFINMLNNSRFKTKQPIVVMLQPINMIKGLNDNQKVE